MNLSQIVSLVSVSILTALAVFVGLELVSLIKESKKTLHKLNSTLDTADRSLERLTEPAAGVFAIIEGLKQSSKIIEAVSHLLGKDKPAPPINIDDNDTAE